MDPEWTIVETGRDPRRRRVTEALFTLAAGGVGTRGSVEEAPPGSAPLVLAAGVYTDAGPEQHLLPGPDWSTLRVDPPPTADRRILDLHAGLLWREAKDGDSGPPLRTIRFASAARPGVVALRAEGPRTRLHLGPALRGPAEVATDERRMARFRARSPAGAHGPQSGDVPDSIAAVAVQRAGANAGLRLVERIAAYGVGPPPSRGVQVGGAVLDPDLDPGLETAVDDAVDAGFDRLLAEHRNAWARRWETVDVHLPDDAAAQLAIRFALFHLWSSVDGREETAVGARGLSGPGYRGHVFWDTDVYVLPAIATMSPSAARAMLAYRLHRLPAARAAARAHGYAGARFPWESAADGTDVTPASGDVGGEEVAIRTGTMEEHVTADVAWAGDHYAAWAGDGQFLVGAGRELLAETARYWASRCRFDVDGWAHIGGVIGPDEYHEDVDDNAYTNVLARWNLRRAAALEEGIAGPSQETRGWRKAADRLVDGYRPTTGRYEQFAGYDDLEPLLATDVARPPVAADVLLGRDRVSKSQIIKQPDVLMLHHLVPDELRPGSLIPDVEFYAPRTAHGSSLSPAVTAAVLARAGRPDEALPLLRLALAVDLEDVTGTTAAGLHLGTMGGVWQAVVAGFAGVRVCGGVVHVDPALPAAWPRLVLRFRCLGRRVRLAMDHTEVEVSVQGRVPVRVGAGRTRIVNGVERITYAAEGAR